MTDPRESPPRPVDRGPGTSGETHHYFTAQPTAAHRPGLVRVVLPDLYLELETDSGMFSPGRLDPGTRFLLESELAPAGAGDLLDLGCGYGPIACTMAARSPGATVWAVDVNERALALCERNAARAGLSNVRCATPDAPGLPGQLRRDLVQPAGQDRQAGPARAAPPLARPARAGRRRDPGNGPQPGGRLAPRLAGKRGRMAGAATVRAQRLPSAAGNCPR